MKRIRTFLVGIFLLATAMVAGYAAAQEPIYFEDEANPPRNIGVIAVTRQQNSNSRSSVVSPKAASVACSTLLPISVTT